MLRFFYCLFAALLLSCQPQVEEQPIDLSQFVLQEGFTIETVASEPLIEAPVAMTFDNQGRIWVLEMPDYMPNIHGSDEDTPRGRVVILEDQNGNGRMDKAKVFLEKLAQPRAIALVYGGLLLAETPNLWFVEIENDEPGEFTLVDSTYAIGGNVEHLPNGLMMNVDNWIYNAKCNYRYRRVDGKWLKEPTAFRGQWGITHDDYGRLFYNDNSNPLFGDFMMPNQLTRNPYLQPMFGENQEILEDRRVYPLHSTAINRGYVEGNLDENGVLLSFTSACSPLIYRSENFGEVYNGNAFVCAPEANLIKRVLLEQDGTNIIGTQAWEGEEFLASTDEGFRPVSLNNAPDGNLYITDMHRGIIQHKVYMTAYLKKLIEERQLDTIVNAGRIFRVKKDEQSLKPINLEQLSTTELADLFYQKNSWLRDRAQQLLIYRNDKNSILKLKEIALDASNSLAQLHALWTLEGLKGLDEKLLEQVAANTQDLNILEKMPLTKAMQQTLFKKNNPRLDLQLVFAAANDENNFELLQNIMARHPNDSLFAEAIVSSLTDREEAFLKQNENELLKSYLTTVIENKKMDNKNFIYQLLEHGQDGKTLGRILFNEHCAACHSVSGEGIKNLAPSLLKADLVEMDARCVARIILHGLQGEIHVAGKAVTYQAAMPGLKDNAELTDEKIAAITSYVKNAFSLSPEEIPAEVVTELRAEAAPKGGLFSEKELLNICEKQAVN